MDIKILKMYRQWAVLNVFMMSSLQLVQGSSYEHGPVKVGALSFSVMQSFPMAYTENFLSLPPIFQTILKYRTLLVVDQRYLSLVNECSGS